MRPRAGGGGAQQDFLAFLEAQRADFAERLPARIAAAVALAERVVRGDASDDTLDRLEREAHALAGSCGTFGFAEAGAAARALEDAAARARREPGVDDVARALIATRGEALRRWGGR